VRALIVNPNTTVAMTERIAAGARAAAAAGTIIDAVTSAMGPDSIEGYYDEAFAVPGVIQAMLAGEREAADAGIIACFDDTGLDAARSAVAMPVVGICEAAIHLASPIAQRFSIVTTLSRSIPPLEALADRYGVSRRCRVRASEVPVLALERKDGAAVARIEAEIAKALAEDRAEAIILGCAGMTDLAASLAAKFGVPVIDGVAAAVKLVEALVGLGLRTAKIGGYAAPLAKSYRGAMADFAPRGP
jgi:allantoin racemase